MDALKARHHEVLRAGESPQPGNFVGARPGRARLWIACAWSEPFYYFRRIPLNYSWGGSEDSVCSSLYLAILTCRFATPPYLRQQIDGNFRRENRFLALLALSLYGSDAAKNCGKSAVRTNCQIDLPLVTCTNTFHAVICRNSCPVD